LSAKQEFLTMSWRADAALLTSTALFKASTLTQARAANTLPSMTPNLLNRITFNPEIFGGKPIIRGRRLAVEHVLGQLAAGDTIDVLLQGYPWLERDDVLACLEYARATVGSETVLPLPVSAAA
jgi:uncharacterized protein (DUF433 family)